MCMRTLDEIVLYVILLLVPRMACFYSAYFGDKHMHYEHIPKCTTTEGWEREPRRKRDTQREIDVEFQVIIQICGMLRLFWHNWSETYEFWKILWNYAKTSKVKCLSSLSC